MDVPCTQCLNCRINIRDYWTTRCLLEHHDAISGQFWTLTFSDDGLQTLDQLGPRLLVRKFLNAIRLAERRAMNPERIRSFGVLEYGGELQRPHIHMLLWNNVFTQLDPTPYKPGMPRPTLTSKQWPHGHVDVQNLNLNSARYVCKYVTKFEDPEAPTPTTFHALRPKLGLHGLRKYLTDLSRGPLRNEELQPFIRLDGKRWALPPALRDDFYKLSKKLGLRFPESNMSSRYIDAIARHSIEAGNPWHLQNRTLQKEQTLEMLHQRTNDIKARRLYEIMQRASSLASS
ncbi:replication initiator protein [Microviridae sp.]|nr:replication initiator protein [Microviridae sp.]